MSMQMTLNDPVVMSQIIFLSRTSGCIVLVELTRISPKIAIYPETSVLMLKLETVYQTLILEKCSTILQFHKLFVINAA